MTRHYNCSKCGDKLCMHKVPIFSSLDREELEKIVGLIQHRKYDKGETLESVKTCNLSKKQFQQLLYSFPEIAVKIIDELGSRMTRLENQLQSIGVRNVDNRIGSILIEFAQKYGTKDGTNTIIHLPLSREGIANYLGVARETVSRKFSQMENEGLIYSINNKEILIPDMDKIEAIALN